jgi:hypothetical protein
VSESDKPSSTPRTTAVQAAWEAEGCSSAITFIQLARQLERELAEAREKLEDEIRTVRAIQGELDRVNATRREHGQG